MPPSFLALILRGLELKFSLHCAIWRAFLAPPRLSSLFSWRHFGKRMPPPY